MIEIEIHEEKGREITQQLAETINKAVADGLNAVALMAMGEAQKSILRGKKTGRIYKRGKKTHQASAPGEAPANDLGFLASKISVEVDYAETSAVLRSSAPYSVHLEYGTRKMTARPFFRPAVEKIKPQAKGVIDAYVSAATKKAGQ